MIMQKKLKKRECAINLAITLKLSYEETQELLNSCDELELYSRDRRDSIVIWAIYHGKELEEVNEICKKYNCETVLGIEEILKNVMKREIRKGE